MIFQIHQILSKIRYRVSTFRVREALISLSINGYGQTPFLKFNTSHSYL